MSIYPFYIYTETSHYTGFEYEAYTYEDLKDDNARNKYNKAFKEHSISQLKTEYTAYVLSNCTM